MRSLRQQSDTADHTCVGAAVVVQAHGVGPGRVVARGAGGGDECGLDLVHADAPLLSHQHQRLLEFLKADLARALSRVQGTQTAGPMFTLM